MHSFMRRHSVTRTLAAVKAQVALLVWPGMEHATPKRADSRPGLLRRAAAGAWHVPAGFVFLARHPRLWPLAALPALVALVLVATFALLGLLVAPRVESAILPAAGRYPEWIALPASVLLFVATRRCRGVPGARDRPRAFVAAARAAVRAAWRRAPAGAWRTRRPGSPSRWVSRCAGAVYFLLAAPVLFLLGLVPIVGPLLSLMWGARAVALQMTDPALTRRGMSFADKRRWHAEWRVETQGFGLAGMIGLIVPLANLLLGPALVTGGTLLVLELEDASGPRAQARDAGAGGTDPARG